jgi:hypothetical protein
MRLTKAQKLALFEKALQEIADPTEEPYLTEATSIARRALIQAGMKKGKRK